MSLCQPNTKYLLIKLRESCCVKLLNKWVVLRLKGFDKKMGRVKVDITTRIPKLRRDTNITHQHEFPSLVKYIKWTGAREVKYLTT